MNVKVLIVTTPVHVAFRKALNEEQLNLTILSAEKLAKDFKNVYYYNFIDNSLFDESDFKDGDHLNANGAQKFTLLLNKIINEKSN